MPFLNVDPAAEAGAAPSAPGPTLPDLTPGGVPSGESPLDTLSRTIFGGPRPSTAAPGSQPAAPPQDYGGPNLDLSKVPGNVAAGAAAVIGAIPNLIPTGWVPGGADSQFTQLGDWIKQNDPTNYSKWQAVNAAAGQGFLPIIAGSGGNLKSDFVREWGTYYANKDKGGLTGVGALNPNLAFGPAGSLGGALADALGIVQLPSLAIQRWMAGGKGGPLGNGGDRVDEVLAKAKADPATLTPLEQTVVENVQSGAWTHDHGIDYLVSHGEGISDNGLVQIAGSLATDPLMWASLGSGAMLGLGAKGAAVAEEMAGRAAIEAGGGEAAAALGAARTTSNIEALGKAVYAAQTSQAAPIWKAARFVVDPFGAALGKSSVTRGTVDLMAGGATEAVQRGYGYGAIKTLQGVAERFGVLDSFNQAMGEYAGDLANQFTATMHRGTLLAAKLPATLLDTTPDSVVGYLTRNSARGVVDRLTDYVTRIRYMVRPGEEDQLAERAVSAFGGASKDEWAAAIKGMSYEEKSALHAATYRASYTQFQGAVDTAMQELGPKAAITSKLPKMVLLNENQLDNVTAQHLIAEMTAAQGDLAQQVAVWNAALDRFPELRDLGSVEQNSVTITRLMNGLVRMLPSLHTRVTADELKAMPDVIRNFLDSHPNWNLGFRPNDDQLWGLAQNARGQYVARWSPWVTHVRSGDVAPMARSAGDTYRNFLGQIIGEKAAGALTRPVSMAETYIRTGMDQVSGQRMMTVVGQRLERNLASFGISKETSRSIFRAVQDMAHTKDTQVAGLGPEDIWKASSTLVPEGVTIGKREMVNSILDAAGGDMRIMGLTSGFTQRARSALVATGLPIAGENLMGRITVDAYNKLRYLWNPVFRIQATTDAAFFNIIHGIMPVFSEVKEGTPLWRMGEILRRMGDTGIAKDFELERPEYTNIADTRNGMQAALAGVPGAAQRLEQGATKGSRFMRNNMVKAAYSNAGDVVRNSLEQAAKAAAKDGLDRPAFTWEEWRAFNEASNLTGKALGDNELGLRYLEQMFNSGLSEEVTSDGLLNFRKLIAEGAWHQPADLGELRPLELQYVALQAGFKNVAELRKAIGPSGTKGVQWLRELMTRGMGADAEYTNRAVRALTFDYNTFLTDTQEALQLDAKQTYQLGQFLTSTAALRGMNPDEYISQIMHTNVGGADLNTEMGKLVKVLQGVNEGSEAAQLKAMVAAFQPHVDLSAQRTLVNWMIDSMPKSIQDAYDAGNAVEGQRLQTLLENLRGGWAQRVPPGSYLEHSRVVEQSELDALQQRGEEILGGIGAEPEHAGPLSIDGNAIYNETMTGPNAWGGVTWDPRTGQAVRTVTPDEFPADMPYMYHGGKMANHPSVKGAGVVRGDWTSDPNDPLIPKSSNVVYRAKEGALQGGTTKAGGWRSNPRVGANNLEMSTDGQKTWQRVNRGPWASGGLTNTGRLTIAEAKDPAAFQAELDRFTTQNESLLRMPGHYVGVFRNPDDGEVQFDVAALTHNEADTEAVQAAVAKRQGRPESGGAYDLAGTTEDPGVYSPRVANTGWGDAANEGFADVISKRIASGQAHPNPDVERAVQYFAKWSKELGKTPGLERATAGRYVSQLVKDIPTDAAHHANYTESITQQLLNQRLGLAQRDAFRLAYAQTQRSVLERTVNHPFFGIYPSSYMWGKVFPEMARFIAKEPFGVQTGAVMLGTAHAMQSIAAQREYDPGFSKMVDGIGNSPAVFLLSYLTPSLPWDEMRASAPPWFKSLAQKGLNLGKMGQSELDMIDPKRWVKFFASAGNEAIVTGQKVAPAIPAAVQKLTQSEQPTPAAPTAPTPPNLRTTVPATGLSPILQNEMEQLRSILSNP